MQINNLSIRKNTPHDVVKYTFSTSDPEYQEALNKAKQLANKVNPHAPDGTIRKPEKIFAVNFAGCLAEIACINYFNGYFRQKNAFHLRAHSTNFNPILDDQQIDIMVTNSIKQISSTVEVRSSFSYAQSDINVYNQYFSLVGYYSSPNKPMETSKDFYVTVIFRFDESYMPEKIKNGENITLHIAAGASKDLLIADGEWDNLQNGTAQYRVIKPIINAWSVNKLCDKIIDHLK